MYEVLAQGLVTGQRHWARTLLGRGGTAGRRRLDGRGRPSPSRVTRRLDDRGRPSRRVDLASPRPGDRGRPSLWKGLTAGSHASSF
eukprot:11226035-Lingulodinium_polyedra.AAC.1